MFSPQKNNAGVKSSRLSVPEFPRLKSLRWKHSHMWHTPCSRSCITGDPGHIAFIMRTPQRCICTSIRCIPDWLDEFACMDKFCTLASACSMQMDKFFILHTDLISMLGLPCTCLPIVLFYYFHNLMMVKKFLF